MSLGRILSDLIHLDQISGIATDYLFINEGLHELQWFKKSHISWFLGDYVCEGNILCLSFIILLSAQSFK